MPVGETPGPASGTVIDNGKFHIKSTRGIRKGKYRVEIVAKKRTGKEIDEFDGFEKIKMSELVVFGPKRYSTRKSPLIYEVTENSDGEANFELPAE